MKIALYGATGMIGQRVLAEALSRGHEVTAIVRDTSKLADQDHVTAVSSDILNADDVAKVVAGHDAVVASYAAPHETPDDLSVAARSLIKGLGTAGVMRLVVVGGAGSLEVAPGVRLVDTPDFPEAWKGAATSAANALDVYRNEANDLDWTYFSPAALIQPGERLGKFRLGGDQLVTDERGESRISAEDFSIALIDELENPKYIKQRFTVGY